ncbi:MAG: TlpA family protein disulfide reductase [Defluviitaleaceae bacterium]|nr:TlpA family protein disulfide reductase [Defluviitaleaceae bacterium]
MYKRLAVVFGIVALAVIVTAVVIAHDWLGEDRDAPRGRGQGTMTQLDITSENLPADLVIQPDPGVIISQAEIDVTMDFAMYDVNGNQVQLSDFFGKPIVLNFWASWCYTCVQEISYFEQFYAEVSDDAHIIKVNMLDGELETRERVDSFMADGGYDFPLFFDTGAGATLFGVQSIPMTFFIDSRGQLVSTVSGMATLETLRVMLQLVS